MSSDSIILFLHKRQLRIEQQEASPAGRSTLGAALPTPGGAELANAATSATRGFLPDGPLASMLGAAGHSRACIMRFRSGLAMTCSCGAASEPEDQAAQAVGQAIRLARMAVTQRVPHGVIAALVEQVDAGNAAAILVWQWLVKREQIPARCALRPRLRLVCKRS